MKIVLITLILLMSGPLILIGQVKSRENMTTMAFIKKEQYWYSWERYEKNDKKNRMDETKDALKSTKEQVAEKRKDERFNNRIQAIKEKIHNLKQENNE